jgi:hypothetical protein
MITLVRIWNHKAINALALEPDIYPKELQQSKAILNINQNLRLQK